MREATVKPTFTLKELEYSGVKVHRTTISRAERLYGMTARKRIHCSRRDLGDIQIAMHAISIIISIVKYGGDPVMPWECFSSSETGLPVKIEVKIDGAIFR